MKYKIAIVGGSITGCILGQLLKENPNIDVSIFERSSNALESRGAGITLPLVLINKVNLLLGDKPCPFYPMDKRIFFVKDDYENTDNKREIWQQAISAAAINWGMLYESLRFGLDDIYHSGCNIKNIECAPDVLPTLEFDNGEKKQFDLVVCADGYNSLGKKILFPENKLNYAGYIARRGMASRKKGMNDEFLGYYCFEQGHLIAYPIPGKNVDHINWALYAKMTEEDLAEFMHIQQPSKPLTESSQARLQDLAKKCLPLQASEMIAQSYNVFYQVVYDGMAPSVSKNNVVLMGDASKVLRPHLGSGAAEGIRQAFDLAHQIESNATLVDAISTWTLAENSQSETMAALASRLGNTLVNSPPDWERMTPDLMEEWWKSVMIGKTSYLVDDAKKFEFN
ncbi:MAG: hypothetical protein K2Q14_04100 [Gammaproteobacteria bacterium]|nr:hypothetical protein [Gammaproteobacteria bacterium]